MMTEMDSGSRGGDSMHEVAQIIMTSGPYAQSCEVVPRSRELPISAGILAAQQKPE